MLTTWQKLAPAVGTAVALCLVALPSGAAITVKNTATYIGAGRWDWTIFVEADPDSLRHIECVEYVLHPTFPDPVRKVCNQQKTNFAYSTNGWGVFTVKVNIRYKDGHVDTRKHLLVFSSASPTTPLNVAVKNRSKQIEPGWWVWALYADGAKTELDRIRCVEYTLHPTFANPVRVICDRPSRFELSARGWGTFTVGVKLMLKDGSVRSLSYPLELR